MISLLLSLWCNPILGSSKTYNTPDNLDPIWVAKRILCASPPDNVPALLASVKYSNPTLIKNLSLSNISLVINLLISCCYLFNFKLDKKSYSSLILSLVIS